MRCGQEATRTYSFGGSSLLWLWCSLCLGCLWLSSRLLLDRGLCGSLGLGRSWLLRLSGSGSLLDGRLLLLLLGLWLSSSRLGFLLGELGSAGGSCKYY